MRFCAVGVLNTAIHILVAATCVKLLLLHVVLANLLGFLAANVASYSANATWTYGAGLAWRRYPRFLASSLVSLVASTGAVLLWALLGWDYMFGVVVGAAVSAGSGFLLAERWVFRGRSAEPLEIIGREKS